MNEAGTKTYFDKPGVIEALQYWVDLSRKHKVMPPGIVEWGTTPKDFFEKKAAMMWTTTGNLTNVRNNAKIPVRRRDAAGEEAPRQPDRRRQFLHLQEDDAGRAAGGRSSSSSGRPRRSAPRSGASTPATSRSRPAA